MNASKLWWKQFQGPIIATWCALVFPFGTHAWAQSYPVRSVRVVIAFGAGGMADIVGRTIAQNLAGRLGQNFYIDNRPGAGGAIGAELVSSANPDGYTLLVTTAGLAIRAVAQSGAVDPRTQLTPIAFLASTPSIFVVNGSAKASDLMKFVRSKKDGRFTYGSPGVGTLEHLTSEYVFKSVPGLHPIHVPFPGGADAINAILGQQVDLVTTALPATSALIQEGKLRVIAVASHKRMLQLPDAPTLGEAGFPDLENISWIAMFGPARLPESIAKKLNTAVNEALQDQGLRDRLFKLGLDTRKYSQADFAAYIASEIDKWKKITKSVGFTIK